MNHKNQFLKFVLPSVLSMLVFNLYTMVDGIYVARFVGETALAAVNISMPYINFIFAFSILFSVGTSTVCAILRGQNKIEEANRTFTMNTLFLSTCGILITIVAVLFKEELAVFLGASESTMPYVMDYLGVLIWFSFFFIVSYSLEVLVKTDGFPKLATVAVCIGALTNIVFDYVFVVSFSMGIKGAAIATGMSQVLTFVVFFYHFAKVKGTIHWCRIRPDFSIYKRIIPIGTADFITELSAGVIVFLFNHAILKYIGDSGIVTYTVITYVYNLVMMSFTGISQGTQPLVSFYYGKKEKATCRLYLQYARRATFFLSLLYLFICLVGTEFIIAVFIDRQDAVLFSDSVIAFRKYSLCYLLMGYNIIYSGYFAAIEKSRYSFTISLLRGFILIAISIWMMSFLFQGTGIWYATLLCEAVCLCFTVFFMKHHKKHKRSDKELLVSSV